MTEDESSIATVRPDDGDLLQYDFFKHLTSLALLTLGGVLILAEKASEANVKSHLVLTVLVLISGAGVCAFSGASEIVRSRQTKTPPLPTLKFYRMAAPALLGIGVGMFLTLFADSLT